MSSGRLRVRAAVDRHYSVVVAVAVVCLLVGGWMAMGAYLFPGTHTVDRTVSEWSVDGNFSHAATVEGNATAFEPGTVVHDRTVYFESVMPVLDVTHAFSYQASGNGSVDAVVEPSLVMKAVSGTGEEDVTYWTVREDLGSNRVSEVSPGEEVRTAVTVNVSEAMGRARQITEELGTPSALLRAEIVFEVRTGGVVNNHTVNESMVFVLPMSFRGGIYEMQTPVVPPARFDTAEAVTVRNPAGFVGGVVAPLLFVGGLAGGGIVVWARREGQLALTDRERTWLTYRVDRSEYDDWISRVALPDDAFDREVIEAATLADLVDVAIDADEPVLEDRDVGNYHVLHDGYRYTFERPSVPGSVRAEPRSRDVRTRSGTGSGAVEALRERPYQRLRQIAAREGLDVGASPSKADLVNALARAGVDPEEDGEGAMATDGQGSPEESSG